MGYLFPIAVDYRTLIIPALEYCNDRQPELFEWIAWEILASDLSEVCLELANEFFEASSVYVCIYLCSKLFF